MARVPVTGTRNRTNKNISGSTQSLCLHMQKTFSDLSLCMHAHIGKQLHSDSLQSVMVITIGAIRQRDTNDLVLTHSADCLRTGCGAPRFSHETT